VRVLPVNISRFNRFGTYAALTKLVRYFRPLTLTSLRLAVWTWLHSERTRFKSGSLGSIVSLT
jgi:hypothetical protein